MTVSWLVTLTFAVSMLLPFWLLRKLIARSWAVACFELRLWTRWFATVTAVCALLESVANIPRWKDIVNTNMRFPDSYLVWFVDLPIGVIAYFVACSAPQRRILLIRKFNADRVNVFVRHEVVPYLGALGRMVTLSDRLLDRGAFNPIWIASTLGTLLVIALVAIWLGISLGLILFALSFRHFGFWMFVAALFSLVGGASLMKLGKMVVCCSYHIPHGLLAITTRVFRQQVQVLTTEDLEKASATAMRFLSRAFLVSPFPPLLAIDCDDALWKDAFKEVAQLADIVVLVAEDDSVSLDWETNLVQRMHKPIFRISDIDTTMCVHEELAKTLAGIRKPARKANR